MSAIISHMHQDRENEKVLYCPSLLKHIRIKNRLIPSKTDREFYFMDYEPGLISIKSSSQLIARYAVSRASIAIKSGHVDEILGESTPRCSLRPLWVKAEESLRISSRWKMSLPSFALSYLKKQDEFSEDNLKKACFRLMELGYNACVFGGGMEEELPISNVENTSLLSLILMMKSFGIKLIWKIEPLFPKTEINPLRPQDRQKFHESLKEIEDIYQHFDYIFYQAMEDRYHFLKTHEIREYTSYEILLSELRMLEETVIPSCSLIYYIPSSKKQGDISFRWLEHLFRDISSRTIIAFSPYLEGIERELISSLHPIWRFLRCKTKGNSTPLMTILNVGCVGQGDGVWPILTLDSIGEVFQRFDDHPFFGVIAYTNHLPQNSG